MQSLGQAKWVRWWQRWGAYGMAVVFTAVIFTLISRQYATFDTRSSDLDRFLQAFWNTVNGRFMYSTIEERTVLSGHFSPIFLLLVPLQFIWNDPRVYSLVQTIGFAVAGLFLYKIVTKKHAAIAPWFLLAFYLNPVLHTVALLELRRITFAVPFLAIGLYGLAEKRRWVTAVGFFLALLCKENVALIVVMVGIYLIAIERDWRWGSAFVALGIAWAGMVIFVINPLVDPRAVKVESAGQVYRGFNYFATWGTTLPEILGNILRQPFIAFQRAFDAESLQALWRVFLPVGIILPFLAPTWIALILPLLFLMLLSSNPTMHSLDSWYPTSLIPFMFAAIAVWLRDRDKKVAWAGTAVLLFFTLFTFRQESPLPLGKKFIPIRYEIIEHHKLAAEFVEMLPSDASAAVTSAYTPHTFQRDILYLYPWIPRNAPPVDYYLLDRYLKSYPMNEIERNDAINNLIADPEVIIEAEADGIFLMRNGGDPLPAHTINQVADEAILLDRVEIAPADAKGYFINTLESTIQMQPGQTVRVTLYWEAIATPPGERTVSVRIADETGWLWAQIDTKPSNGTRPTSWWQPGWKLRDVYYLTIDPNATPGTASLDVLLYDSTTQEPIPFTNGTPTLHIADIQISQ